MAGRHLHREGTIRIPSGCAIAAMMDRTGGRHDGTDILRSIALMRDRSNGSPHTASIPTTPSCTPSMSCTRAARPELPRKPTWSTTT